MQLILDAESTDIDLKETMSTVDQESLSEKPLANGQVRLIQDPKIERPNGNKENLLNKDNNIIKNEANINLEDKEREEDNEHDNSLAPLVKDDELTDDTKVNLIFSTDNAPDICSEGESIANDANIETESRSDISQKEEETCLENENENDAVLEKNMEVDKETKDDEEQSAFLGKKALNSDVKEAMCDKEDEVAIRKRDHLVKETDKDKDLEKEENNLELEVDLRIDTKLGDKQINKENFNLSKELSFKEINTMEEDILSLENTAILTENLDSADFQDELEDRPLKANDHITESLKPLSIEDQQQEQPETTAVKTKPSSDIIIHQDESEFLQLDANNHSTDSNDPMSIEDQQEVGQPETTAVKTKPSSDIIIHQEESQFLQLDANNHSTDSNDPMSIEDQQEVVQPETTAIKSEPSDIVSHQDELDCRQREINDNITAINDPMTVEDQHKVGQLETAAIKTEPLDIVTHQDEQEVEQPKANDHTTKNNDHVSIKEHGELEQPYTTAIKTEPSDIVTHQDEPEVGQLEANTESSNSISIQNDQEVGQSTKNILKSESSIQNEPDQEQSATTEVKIKSSEPISKDDKIETVHSITVVKTELSDSISEQDNLEVTKARKTAVKVGSTEPTLHEDENAMQVETLGTQELEEKIMDCDEKPTVHTNENISQSSMDCEDDFEITASKNKDVEHPAIDCIVTTKDIEVPTKQDVLPLAMDIEEDSEINLKESTKDVQTSRQELLDADEIKETVAENKIEIVKNNESVVPEKNGSKKEGKTKNLSPILSRLSNTLDILSDDEDEPKNEESQNNKNTNSADKQCINIEDDDDIMVIDEDTNSKDAKNKTVKAREAVEVKQIDNEPKSDSATINLDDFKESECRTGPTISNEKESSVPEVGITDSSKPQINEKLNDQDEKYNRKPLVPDNFFKTYKKNLTDMTRDDLEEFCILKIVESIIDRSNLNEIRSKLKTMAQSIEEYKKKAVSLTKQNRDLQVVLKSVQEEQKKVSDTPISPLKITRSVGMQVLMTDKNSRRKLAGPSFGVIPTANNNITSRPIRSATNQSPRQQKPVNAQQIPVPRLVPASNNTAIKGPSTNHPVNTVPKPSTTPVPNGNKNLPIVPKAEKRSHNRLQSVTVDLTDDEPPSKVPVRNNTGNPVRLVSPQNLLAPRQQMTQSSNSPRKVYIPIGGPPGSNVRPGQTIMLKSVPPSGPRPRGPVNNMVRLPQNSVRMPRVQNSRHPAPLPDAMKQYQPPNWKALPPAPDLKLSKVENGIVISWKIEGYQDDSYEEIASYQLYAYQETSAPPCTTLWKKIGDVKALPLPMACTLTQFMAGFKYYFAVRAVDVRSRLGPFSLPGSILLLNKV